MFDVMGKIVFIMGGNSGIGFEVVKVLVVCGVEIIFVVCNEVKGKEVEKRIKVVNGNVKVMIMLLDFSDLIFI